MTRKVKEGYQAKKQALVPMGKHSVFVARTVSTWQQELLVIEDVIATKLGNHCGQHATWLRHSMEFQEFSGTPLPLLLSYPKNL